MSYGIIALKKGQVVGYYIYDEEERMVRAFIRDNFMNQHITGINFVKVTPVVPGADLTDVILGLKGLYTEIEPHLVRTFGLVKEPQ